MRPYAGFATVYDVFMSDGPYDEWLSWLFGASSNGVLPSLSDLRVADVGCGTGWLAVELSSSCRQVVGVDLSQDMLAEAAMRSAERDAPVSWLCQDVRKLKLPFAADVILSTCDSLNYLLTPKDWHLAFAAVRANLEKSGLFCFDALGPKRIDALKEGLWHDIEDDSAVFYETSVSNDGQVRFDVHAFVLQSASGLYRRIEEEHLQQYVDPDSICGWLEESGFDVLEVLGDFGASDVKNADRVVYVAKASSNSQSNQPLKLE